MLFLYCPNSIVMVHVVRWDTIRPVLKDPSDPSKGWWGFVTATPLANTSSGSALVSTRPVMSADQHSSYMRGVLNASNPPASKRNFHGHDQDLRKAPSNRVPATDMTSVRPGFALVESKDGYSWTALPSPGIGAIIR